MSELSYRAAVAEGIAREMDRDTSVVLIGEDVGAAGGVFKLTEGLFARFGGDRVRDTPISEQAIVGAAMGAAMTGLRPIAELMFSDFFAVTWDMVVNQIAKSRYMTDGQVTIPLVLRTANGAGLRFGAQHSQSVENWAMAIPGLKVVAPSTPADVVGLMASAVRDDDPVIFCEHKALFATKGDVPDGDHVVPLGRAAVVREGADCTIVALAAMVPRAVEAAERLHAEHGIDAEVIDLRCLVPLDVQTILDSVAKTSRLFTVEENPQAAGLGRRDRVDRGRRGLLEPRCADRADHDAAHPAALRVDARGPRDPGRGPHRRDGPRPDGGGEVSEAGGRHHRRPRGHGPDGLGDGSLDRPRGPAPRRQQPQPRAGAGPRRRARRAGRRQPRRRRRRRGRHAHDARRRRRRGRGLRRRARAAGRRAPGLGAGRPEHGDARRAAGLRARRPRRPASGCSIRRSAARRRSPNPAS